LVWSSCSITRSICCPAYDMTTCQQKSPQPTTVIQTTPDIPLRVSTPLIVSNVLEASGVV
jgi:hypothetical protein